MNRDISVLEFLELSRSVVRTKKLFEKVVDDLIRVVGGMDEFSVEQFERFKDLVFELMMFMVVVEMWLGSGEEETPVEYNGGFLYKSRKNGGGSDVA